MLWHAHGHGHEAQHKRYTCLEALGGDFEFDTSFGVMGVLAKEEGREGSVSDEGFFESEGGDGAGVVEILLVGYHKKVHDTWSHGISARHFRQRRRPRRIMSLSTWTRARLYGQHSKLPKLLLSLARHAITPPPPPPTRAQTPNTNSATESAASGNAVLQICRLCPHLMSSCEKGTTTLALKVRRLLPFHRAAHTVAGAA